MKRLAVLILVGILLLTGCTTPTDEQILEKYGIAITVSGTIREQDDSKVGNFTLYTSAGTLHFVCFEDPEAPVNEKNVRDFLAHYSTDGSVTVEKLENGAFYFALPPRDSGSGQGFNVVESYYFVQDGDRVWRISSVNSETQYDRDTVVQVLTSVRFLHTEK